MSAAFRPVKACFSFSAKGAREQQEDFLLVNPQRKVFVVADGFGGPVPGATSARAACEAVRGFLEREAGDLDATLPFVLRTYFSLAGNVLFNALIHANRKCTVLNKGKNVHERGGASVLAGFMDGDLLALANVGICEAWLLRDGKCVELVAPRSYARLQEPFSRPEADELRVPLMAVGMAEDLEPEITEFRVRAGDWLLLQTDGLTPEARNTCLGIQAENRAPGEAVARLEQTLKGFRYSDNVAALLMMF